MSDTNAPKQPNADNTNTQALLSMYEEICKSYHALDDFRMKLLGLLPLTSLVGIFGLSNDSLFNKSPHLVAFIGIFAVVFTCALFIYEIRGIIRCHNLIKKGKHIENEVNVPGQFFVCMKEHNKKSKDWIESISGIFDAKLAACVIYSVVISAWIFTVLRFGFNIEIHYCMFIAPGIGILFGAGAFILVRKLVAA